MKSNTYDEERGVNQVDVSPSSDSSRTEDILGALDRDPALNKKMHLVNDVGEIFMIVRK